MATVHVSTWSAGREEWSIEVPEGGRLLDVLDGAPPLVRFSCRAGTCGTCRIRVLEGAEHLLQASALEASTLGAGRDVSRERLACCAELKPGHGILRVAPVDDFGGRK